MIHLINCKIFEKEIKEIFVSGDYKDVSFHFFPSVCTDSKKVRESQIKIISEISEKDPSAFIEIISCENCHKIKKTGNAADDTGTKSDNPGNDFEDKSGIFKNCHFSSVSNLFYLLLNKKIVDGYISQNSYIITPGWLINWRAHLNSWGFNKDTSQIFFKESVKKIIFLNTGVSISFREEIDAFTDYINLPYEIIEVGTDYLKFYIDSIIYKKRNEIEKNEIAIKFAKASKISADYAMTMDMINQLTNIRAEKEAIKSIIETYFTVFGAEKIIYFPFDNGKSVKIIKKPAKIKLSESERESFIKFEGSYALNHNKDGFFVRIGYLKEKYGVMEISQIPFVQYIDQYINLALEIANVCGLTISNARKYHILNKAKEKYRYIGFHDGLTGLYNRSFFEEEVKRINSDIARFRPVTVISADINWLKETNDNRGHKYGDILIKGAASIISNAIRKTDILARIGGDEFCIILVKTDKVSSERIIKNVIKNQEDFNNSKENLEDNLKISIAIGSYTNDTASSKNIYETVKISDSAMYENKAFIKGSERKF